MKNRFIIFSLIIFFIIFLNNNCFALDTGVYTIDVSSIDYSDDINGIFYQFYQCVKDQLNYDFFNDTELVNNNKFFFSTAYINDRDYYNFVSCSTNTYNDISDYGGYYVASMPCSAGKAINRVEFATNSNTADFQVINLSQSTLPFSTKLILQSDKPISNVSYDFSNYNSSFIQSGNLMGSIIDSGGSGSGGSDVNNNTVSNDVNNNTVSNDVNSNVVSNSVVIDYSDILGRIDNTTQSTNSIVNGIDTSILEMQNTLNDSWNTQDNIDNNVNEIKSILQSQNSNEVINEIQTSSNTTQQYIQNQTQQSATQFNTITDTNNYNQNSVSIDTSWNDISDVNGVDNFINQVTQLLYNYFYGLSNDVAITASFPMPYNQGQVTVSTESITRFYNNYPAVSYLTTMFWYVVFGLYIFRLAYTLWISSVDGTIFRDTEGIVARIDDNNIIKYFML